MLSTLLTHQYLPTHSGYPSLIGILVVTWSSLTILRHPGHSVLFWVFSLPSKSLSDFQSALALSPVGTLSGHHGHSSPYWLLGGILLAGTQLARTSFSALF